MSDSRLLNLYRVPNLQLGTTYAVGVIATVAGQDSPSGTLRFLNMNNAVPNTGLNSDVYPCGQTYSISTFLQAREICRADSYTWRFTNTTSAQAPIFYTRNDGSRFVDLDFVAGLIEGDSYDVEVLAEQGGLIGDYSTICNITIGAPINMIANLEEIDTRFRTDGIDDQEELIYDSRPEWTVDAARTALDANTYNITFSSEDQGEVAQLEIYDINGKSVANLPTATLTVGMTQTLDLSGLPAGIYLAVVSNSTQRQSIKLSTF